jgi:hypothetical protein
MGNITTKNEISRTTTIETNPMNQESLLLSSNQKISNGTKTVIVETQKHYVSIGSMKFHLFTTTHTDEIVEENKGVINHLENFQN